MSVDYRSEPDLSVEEFTALLDASGFDDSYPLGDIARVQRLLRHSDILIAARSERLLIGVARAITDYGHCCFLADLVVMPAFRRQGIGRHLIDEVHRTAGSETSVVTIAGPDAGDFYSRIGMEPRTKGWIKKRTH